MFRPLPLFIGLRYTRARRGNHFISFISMTSILGIALGVTALITVLSVMNGFENELRERILGMAAHATVSGYNGKLNQWETTAQQALAHEKVRGVAPFVSGQVMLSHDGKASGTLIRGVLPAEEPKVSEVADNILHGDFASLQPGEYGIVLGSELARALGAGMGDKVTLIAPQATVTPAGFVPRLKRFTVVAIFEVGMYEFDRSLAMVHMRDAAKVFRMGDAVTGVRLKLEDLFEAPFVAREVAANLSEITLVTDWTQKHANFFSAVRTEKRVMFIILILIVAVAAFNIVSTLVMVVTDKQADIAILRTLGARPKDIQWIFIIQGTIIGLMGTLLGLTGGISLALNVETLVPAIERMFEVQFLSPDLYYISKLPSDLRWDDVSSIGTVAFVLSILATIYPARRAARTNPAEALRYE